MSEKGYFKVHSLRLFNPQTNAIHCLSYDEKLKLLAVARSDGSVEIWDLSATPHIERIIREHTESSVEGLAWCAGRLFSVGIHGFVVEYDLRNLCVKATYAATSGSAWCLAANKEQKLIAVGTEDGYITLFDVLEDSVCYNKVFDKQDGRIICLDWHSSGNYLITGSLDAIRVWNVATGHAITRINPGRDHTNRETIVWSVKMTTDFTVISGDSRGKTCFWDAKLGSLISSVDSHEADVLSLCLSPNQDTLYAAGVDPTITLFSKVTLAGGRIHWVKSVQRRVHTHDVRALCLVDNKLISGGVDTYLNLTSDRPKMFFKYPALPQPGDIKMARKEELVLFKYLNHLELWRLGFATNEGLEGVRQDLVLPLQQGPSKVLQLSCKESQFIRCSDISPNGSLLAYADENAIFVYSLEIGKTVSLKRLAPLPQSVKTPIHLLLDDEKRLIVISEDNIIQIVQLDGAGDHNVLHTIHTECKDSIHLVDWSYDGRYLAVADHQSNIKVYDMKKVKLDATLPRYHSHPTALSIHPLGSRMIVVYADHKIVEFSLTTKRFTPLCKGLSEVLPPAWYNRSSVIRHIAFDVNNPDVIIMTDDSVIITINNTKDERPSNSKAARLSVGDDPEPLEQSDKIPCSARVQLVKKFKYISFMGTSSTGDLVFVEVKPLKLTENLPPALYKKRYGV